MGGLRGRVVVRGRNYETNIKGKKGKADAQMQKVISRHLKQIDLATQSGGGPDPKVNTRLAAVIKAAIKDGVPRDTVDRRIKAASDTATGALTEVRFEGYSPGGAAVIVDTITDNKARTTQEVKDAFKKVDCQTGNQGCVAFSFEKKGIIRFDPGADEDQVMEVSVEAGGEDVETLEDGSIEVLTDPADFDAVTTALQESGMEPVSAKVQLKANDSKELKEEQAYETLRLLFLLEECEDVQEVVSNAIIPEDLELVVQSNTGIPRPYDKRHLGTA